MAEGGTKAGRPRILLTRRWPDAVEAHLAERYDAAFNREDVALSPAQLRSAMVSFDALCPTVTDLIDGDILKAPGASVGLIANYGAGTNHIDLAAARSAGLVVTNTPDVLTDATADLAVLLILMATRRAGEGERELRAGRWTGWRPTHLLGTALQGKTLGLVGYGRIARAVAQRCAQGFGMKIAYYSRSHGAIHEDDASGARAFSSLDALLPEVDILSLHVPGGAETHHLLSARHLALLKRSTVVINTARGSVIDESALAEALRSGQLAAAGLDVYSSEPEVDPRLLALENVVLLPHLGSATREARTAMGMRVAANLDHFFAAEPPPDRVA